MEDFKKVFVTIDRHEQDFNFLLNRIDETRKELKNDILEFKDAILGEIINLRTDFAILTGYRDMIEDHEVRITKLEDRRSS